MLENMECRECGFVGDDVQDFVSTKTPGERFCPRCGSDQCFIIEEREVIAYDSGAMNDSRFGGTLDETGE